MENKLIRSYYLFCCCALTLRRPTAVLTASTSEGDGPSGREGLMGGCASRDAVRGAHARFPRDIYKNLKNLVAAWGLNFKNIMKVSVNCPPAPHTLYKARHGVFDKILLK